jgi:hypothetical protein
MLDKALALTGVALGVSLLIVLLALPIRLANRRRAWRTGGRFGVMSFDSSGGKWDSALHDSIGLLGALWGAATAALWSGVVVVVLTRYLFS